MSILYNSLEHFREEFNSNNHVGKLLKDWTPNIIISSSDTDEKFTIKVNADKKINVNKGEENSQHQILVEAEEETLTDVFTGISNPSEVVLDGMMQVFGSDNDQIRLDAITLIMWGM